MTLAAALWKGFHPIAPVLFAAIVASVLLLGLAAPILSRIRTSQAKKTDDYRDARKSARIEAEITREPPLDLNKP